MEIKVRSAHFVANSAVSFPNGGNTTFSFLQELGRTKVNAAIHNSRKIFNLVIRLGCKRCIVVVLAKRIYENIVREESEW